MVRGDTSSSVGTEWRKRKGKNYMKQVNIDHESALIYCAGNEKFLQEMFVMYADTNCLDKIQQAYAKEDWENYRILVHSLKSTSRTIGENEMADAATRLEAAVKNGDIGQVKALHDDTMELYEAVIDWCRAKKTVS